MREDARLTHRRGARSLQALSDVQDWPSIFPNATCATALIDRVVHHADVIAIEGNSYRLRQAEQRKNARRRNGDNETVRRKTS